MDAKIKFPWAEFGAKLQEKISNCLLILKWLKSHMGGHAKFYHHFLENLKSKMKNRKSKIMFCTEKSCMASLFLSFDKMHFHKMRNTKWSPMRKKWMFMELEWCGTFKYGTLTWVINKDINRSNVHFALFSPKHTESTSFAIQIYLTFGRRGLRFDNLKFD